ncbi:hypothetical protein N7516_005328 [Penicillium verrucosum]|uniref:uncharacterized protein n=1 Tax=Penicillium verrucosum TaxID=60171 RepID=UPI00254528F6|nr:uncharacterized protein N7516_005328 [Penicillium verrucosum]KAJ5945160.1 hypothetical protein N7516_005328 [Penicillium verrucosum]
MIGIVCFAWAMVQHQEGVISSDGLGEAWSTMLLGTTSYGFVWSTIFLIVVLCNCAVHPGVIVAFDFIAFAGQFSTVCIDLHELAYWSLGGYGYSSTHNVGRLYGVECLGCSMVLVGRLRKAGKQLDNKQTIDV